MKKTDSPVNGSVFDVMIELRKFTRSTLMHQSVIAQNMGLHPTDAECIDFLQEMGPSTAGDLARATRLTTGAITSVIDRLEKAGYVKRSADPNDRRKVIVSFIPKKLVKAKVHYKDLAGRIQQLLSAYDDRELKFLIKYTKDLTEIYQSQVTTIEV